MNLRQLLLSAFALAPLCSCLAALTPDIEYGVAAGESLRLNAFVPEGSGPFPAVILVHGGAWSAGDKSGGADKGFIAPLYEPLSQAGFAWFSINYRLAPKHLYPACIEDVETAIRWVKAHAAEYHIDPNRIALAGESAGGHLVALAAVRATAGTQVAAVVAIYTPFDLVGNLPSGSALSPVMAGLFGQTNYTAEVAAVIRQASPINQVKSGLPPFLLLHGTADKRVVYQQSQTMMKQLQKVGVPCELITIKDGNHGMLGWEKLAPGFKQNIVSWLKRTLARQ